MSHPPQGETLLAVYGRYRRQTLGGGRLEEVATDPWELVVLSRDQELFLRTTWRAQVAFIDRDGMVLRYRCTANAHPAFAVAWRPPEIELPHALDRLMGAPGTSDFDHAEIAWPARTRGARGLRTRLRIGDCRPWNAPPRGESVVLTVRHHVALHHLDAGVEPVGHPELFWRSVTSWPGLGTGGLHDDVVTQDVYRCIAGVCVDHEDCIDHLELARVCAGKS